MNTEPSEREEAPERVWLTLLDAQIQADKVSSTDIEYVRADLIALAAFQAHGIDGRIATSLMSNARKQCVKKVREYLTDCRDEETGIIKAIALALESLTLDGEKELK